MTCRGRTVISERRIGPVTVIDAIYAAGSIDPHHSHAFAHLSVLLTGEALEVRGARVERQRHGNGSSQRSGASHVLYFPVETRVLSLTAPFFELPEQISFHGSFDVTGVEEPDAVMALLRRARNLTAPTPQLPQWLRATLRDFPWTSGLPIREASRHAGLHPSHFARAFHKYVGASPRAYRRRAKLQLATRWLLSSSAPLTRVALESGFSDQSHMTVAFTAAYHVPPKQFRRIFAQSS